MKGLLVAAAVTLAAAAAPPVAVAQQETGTSVGSFSLEAAADRETSDYQLVAGGKYGLLLSGVVTDDGGGEYDPLYCRNAACGGPGTHVDNVIGMGFADANRQTYDGTFGGIGKYVSPLPPYTSNSSAYAVRFTAPRSGRLELVTNWGNLTSPPPRRGTLTVDLYRYSEPAAAPPPPAPAPLVPPGPAPLPNPCGLLPPLTPGAARAAACPPAKTLPAPAPGKGLIVAGPVLSAKATKATVDVAVAGGGTTAVAVPERARRIIALQKSYYLWCVVQFVSGPGVLENEANALTAARLVTLGVMGANTEPGARPFALCLYASIVATVRAVEAAEAAKANPATARAAQASPRCNRLVVPVTLVQRGRKRQVPPRLRPKRGIGVNCVRHASGAITLSVFTNGRKTLRSVVGPRLNVAIARGPDGVAGGEMAVRWR